MPRSDEPSAQPNPINIFRPDASGRFLCRKNRFVVSVRLDSGEITDAHAPNPGRLQELYLPDNPVILEASDRPGRKLKYTLVAIRHRDRWVPMVSASANRIAGASILPEWFSTAASIRPEVSIGRHRFDFLIRRNIEQGSTGPPENDVYVEVKSCSLVESNLGLFPDAPSARAVAHLAELSALARAGDVRAMILFVINHGDPGFLAPNYHNDPDFARALIAAGNAGVRIRAANVTCDAAGNIRRSGTGTSGPRILTDGIERIISADSGWLLSFEKQDARWRCRLSFCENGFESARRSLRRRVASEKHIIPLRTRIAEEFARRLREGLEAMEGIVAAGKSEPEWMFDRFPLEHREFNRLLFDLRHELTLEELLRED
jgi:sugar fermentation stimulation protein A